MKIRTDNSLQYLHWWGLVQFPYFVHLVNHNEKSALQITVHRTGEHTSPYLLCQGSSGAEVLCLEVRQAM